MFAGVLSLQGVVGPDEPSGVNDDEIYTNAIASQTILFAAAAARALQLPPLPASWLAVAAAPYLPLNTTLPGGGGLAIHPESSGYKGGVADCCRQHYPHAVVALLAAVPVAITHPPLTGFLRCSCSDESPGRGCCIEQSAAALLQYPLGLPLPEDVRRNDLLFYEPRTQANGFFTGMQRCHAHRASACRP